MSISDSKMLFVDNLEFDECFSTEKFDIKFILSYFDNEKETFILGTTIKTDQGQIHIVDRGFTGKFGFGMHYAGGYNEDIIVPAIDFKFFFFQRYSAGIGSTLDNPFLWGSRHLDDLIPVLKPKNVELAVGWGRPYADFGHDLLMIGLRSNF